MAIPQAVVEDPTGDGRIVIGDCLGVMSEMPSGSVDLCYLDPPYCTGRDFGAFDDRWQEPGCLNDASKASSAASATAAGVNGYMHYMRPRIAECHRLLGDAGSIFVHLDWRMSHHVRHCLDLVFGAERFLNEIVWHYGLGAFNATRRLPRKHDTILWYARGADHTFVLQRGDVTAAMEARYNMADESGRYFVQGGRRHYMRGGRAWDDVWDIPSIPQTSAERTGYPTQKPVALLQRIVSMASREGDTVIDPFCGSGTALVAAKSLGRKFIGIDSSDEACRVAMKRIEAANRRGTQQSIPIGEERRVKLRAVAHPLPLLPTQ